MSRRADLYQTLRRRIAPVAFFIALGVLASRTCKSDVAEVDIVMELGARASSVRALHVDVFRDGDSIGVLSLERRYGDDGAATAPRMHAKLDRGSYEMLFSVTLEQGQRRFRRVIVVEEGATITVDLERDLTPLD